MKTLGTVACLMLLLLGAREAAGQAVDKTPELTAGGRTIGGPGTFKGPGPDSVGIYFGSGGVSLSVCVTVVNLSAAGVLIVFDGGAANNSVDIGATRTICRNATEEIELNCGATGIPCKLLWRVDLAP